MPYDSKRQAKAVLANTSEDNPRHRHARAEAKKALRKKKKGMRDVAPERMKAKRSAAKMPTHVRGRQGALHPVSPAEWKLLRRAWEAGGFDSPARFLRELPKRAKPPRVRRRKGGGIEIHLDPAAARGI